MDQVDAVVVGAGVVGLAVARQLALAGREVLILEAAARFGTGASARNSEVIHAGMYYAPSSLKARLCVGGRERLYEFCAGRAIPHRRCEKLIVATTDAELPGLARVAATAQANGVELTRLDRAAAQALEPQLSCAAALHSPLTGIIDSQACMLALLGDAESRGASLACGSALTRVVLSDGAALIGVNGAQPALRARTLVNCAGVQAPQVARLMEGLSPAQIPAAYFVKGSYFALKGRAPFERLIYPLPDAGGLGIHLTLDLGSRARFGPDVEWVDSCDYRVDARRAPAGAHTLHLDLELHVHLEAVLVAVIDAVVGAVERPRGIRAAVLFLIHRELDALETVDGELERMSDAVEGELSHDLGRHAVLEVGELALVGRGGELRHVQHLGRLRMLVELRHAEIDR